MAVDPVQQAQQAFSTTASATTAATQAGLGAKMLGSLKAAFNPWTIGFAIGLTAIERRQQDREERRHRRRLSEQAALDPRQVDAGAILGKAYGYVRFPALSFWHNNNKGIPLIPSGLIGTLTPSVPGGTYVWGRGNQCKMEQFAIQAGSVTSVDEILINGLPINDRQYRGYIAAELTGPGVPSPMATAFEGTGSPAGERRAWGTGMRERDATAKGTGFSKLTVAVNYLPSKLPLTGAYTIVPIGKGAPVRTIQANGRLSTAYRFSTNLIEILLDMFLDPENGLGWPVSAFNLGLCRIAQERAARIVQAGDMAGNDNPMRRPTQTVAQRRAELGLGADWSGYAPSSIFGQQRGAARAVPVRRYEYSLGGLNTVFDSAEAQVFSALQLCPDLVMAQDDDGLWYFDVPDSVTAEATQSVAKITDADLYGKDGYFQLQPPTADTLITQVTSQFDDIDNDFNPGTDVFPRPGSAGANQLRDAFGGVFPTTLSVRGAFGKQQVRTLARTRIATSFRPLWHWPVHKTDAGPRAGQVVECESSLHGRSRYVRILKRERVTNEQYMYTGREFDKDDFDHVLEAEALFELQAQRAGTAQRPATYTVTREGTSVRHDWTMPEDFSELVNGFQIEVQNGEAWDPLVLVPFNRQADSDAGTVESGLTYLEANPPSGTRRYRIATQLSNGLVSDWLMSNNVVVTQSVLDIGLPSIYKRAATQPNEMDRPTEDALWTFATSTLTFPDGGANGWSATPPSGDGILWERVAAVAGDTATEPIAPERWSNVVRSGAAGLSFGLVRLWTGTATDTPPAASTLPARVTYNFLQATVTMGLPSNSIWKQNLSETEGRYKWLALAAVTGVGQVDTVDRAEFDISLSFVEGQDGSGRESIYRLASEEDRQAFLADKTGWAGRPLDTYPFERPVSPWLDDPPDITDDMPVVLAAVRRVPGTPAAGAVPDLTAGSGWGRWFVYVHGLSISGRSVDRVRVWKLIEGTDPPAADDRPDDATYRFSDNTLSYAGDNEANGWATTVPESTEGSRIWSRIATANSRTDTDEIPSTSWSGPVHDEGADGINQATIILQQRSAARPEPPAVDLTYDFASARITDLVTEGDMANNMGWLQPGSVPEKDGNPLWWCVATAASDTATDTIESAEWEINEVVADGAAGRGGISHWLRPVQFRQTGTGAAGDVFVPIGVPASFVDAITRANVGQIDRLTVVAPEGSKERAYLRRLEPGDVLVVYKDAQNWVDLYVTRVAEVSGDFVVVLATAEEHRLSAAGIPNGTIAFGASRTPLPNAGRPGVAKWFRPVTLIAQDDTTSSEDGDFVLLGSGGTGQLHHVSTDNLPDIGGILIQAPAGSEVLRYVDAIEEGDTFMIELDMDNWISLRASAAPTERHTSAWVVLGDVAGYAPTVHIPMGSSSMGLGISKPLGGASAVTSVTVTEYRASGLPETEPGMLALVTED